MNPPVVRNWPANSLRDTEFRVSGLDAFNALSVVESLVTLARDYNRTVVFTIHQPRSNIVALFDQILLLAQGKLIYSGEAAHCHEYLTKIGHPCPPGFNLADFLSACCRCISCCVN